MDMEGEGEGKLSWIVIIARMAMRIINVKSCVRDSIGGNVSLSDDSSVGRFTPECSDWQGYLRYSCLIPNKETCSCRDGE